MPDMIKYAKFTADVILALLSEATDDYLYLWDIQNGAFYISDHAYKDLGISRRVETGAVSVWSSIMTPKDQEHWLADMQPIWDGIKDYHDIEYRVYNRSGQIIWVSCRGTVKKDEDGRLFSITGRIFNTGKQNKLDNVTELMSRGQFEQDTKLPLKRGQDVQGVMVALDIDDSESINKEYSYILGDGALNLLSALISSLLPKKCQLYRPNGDEFVFFLENGTEEGVRYIYENIQITIGSYFTVEDWPIMISVSAGACFLPGDGEIYHKLFQNVEDTAEAAEMDGKNQLVFFSKEMYRQRLHTMELQESPHTHVKKGFHEFGLFYQPQVEIGAGIVIGAEAPFRQRSPKHGEISPAEFIPLLRGNRLIT